jgi:hypothetical protein
LRGYLQHLKLVRHSGWSRPAYYQYERGPPLCLSCSSKATDIAFKDFLMAAAMANQAEDYAEAATGIRIGGDRVPAAAMAAALAGAPRNTHININRSNVGVVNTGDRLEFQ